MKNNTKIPDGTIGTHSEHAETQQEQRSRVFTLLGDAQDYISVVADLLAYKSKSFIVADPVVTVLKAAMTKIDQISIELDEGEEKL